MSRLIPLIIGFIAGWFLKDSNWKEWLESLKTPQQPAPKTISLQENEVTESESSDEVFADELEKLTGIGPASKAKLNDHGIYTFSQIAAMTPEKLKEITGARVKAQAVIEHAKKLSA